MRYLAKAQSPKVRLLVDAVEWKKAPAAEVQIGGYAVKMETRVVVNAKP
jgi:hypothetical protein